MKISENKSVLTGIDITTEEEKSFSKVAEVETAIEEQLNATGTVSGIGETIAELMGAEARPRDIAQSNIEFGGGDKVAEQGVLTGAVVDGEMADELKDVAETMETLKDAGPAAFQGKSGNAEIDKIADTLSSAMGVRV